MRDETENVHHDLNENIPLTKIRKNNNNVL